MSDKKSKKSEIAKMNNGGAEDKGQKKSEKSSKKNGNNFRINDNMVGENE
ncbi:hypothetical protein [Croceitalea dokdonensis]|nr:hypothetical protein [Croceitalea dokdonensis]